MSGAQSENNLEATIATIIFLISIHSSRLNSTKMLIMKQRLKNLCLATSNERIAFSIIFSREREREREREVKAHQADVAFRPVFLLTENKSVNISD
jgi:hypothetical protein